MPDTQTGTRIRPLDELDIESIVRIDERISQASIGPPSGSSGWLLPAPRPGASQVAEVDGHVVGFMLGELRAGEFGLEEPSGGSSASASIPSARGKDLGKLMFEAMRRHFQSEGALTVRRWWTSRTRRFRASWRAWMRALAPAGSGDESCEREGREHQPREAVPRAVEHWRRHNFKELRVPARELEK